MQKHQDSEKDLTANPLDPQTDTDTAAEIVASGQSAEKADAAQVAGDSELAAKSSAEEAEAASAAAPVTAPEAEAVTAPAAEAVAEPGAEVVAEPEAASAAEPVSEPAPESAVESVGAPSEPEPEPAPVLDQRLATESGSAADESAADQEAAPQAQAESAPESESEAKSESEPKAEPESNVASVPDTEAGAEAEAEAEAGAEAEAEAEPAPAPAKVPFSKFNLVPSLARAIADLGFDYCTPIQAQSLRYTLVGYDVTGKAQTGTGKTAAFLITIINDLLRNPQREQRYIGEPRALVLAPTRELVMQIANDAEDLCKHTGLHVVTLVGGEDYQRQLRKVDKKPVDIVVATPGRLIDFLQQDHLYLGLIELLVIDEADRMLDMGFIPQVRNIVARTPHKDCRQTLLFSATFTPEILELTSRWAMDPIMIEIAPERVATETVEQIVYLVTSESKYNLLYNLIGLQGSDKVIIFSNRRDQVRKLADNLHRHGVNCGMLSGEVAQKKRIQTLEGFRDGKIKVLVATDVAGRGLHIDDVTHVINYTLPEEAEDYVHRIGRTGRAGAVGTSISFACEEDSFLLPNIEEKLGQKLPCVHPDSALLADPPPFTRASRFKDEGKTSGGRGGRGGSSRSGGGRPRPQR